MTIQSLKDLLRACVLEQGGTWDNYLSLIEFTYNNNFYSSIRMNHMRRCTIEGVELICTGMSQERVLCSDLSVH